MRKCPICNREYTSPPALNRKKDGPAEICPTCATKQALEDAGILPGSNLYDAIIAEVIKNENIQ